MAELNLVRSTVSLVICLALLCIKPQIAAAEWFPFDMAVDDFWVTDEKGFRTSGNVTVPEGTALEIHCLWAVRPTKYVEVNQEIWWNGNVVLADDHTQGLFPIKIPPGKYGKKTWTSGGVLGVLTTQHSASGAMKLDGEFKTGWNAVGEGDHKLGCVLDSFDINIDLEETRANNRRDLTVTVTAQGAPESGNVSSADAVASNAQQVDAAMTTSIQSARSTRRQQADIRPEPATTMEPAARALRTQSTDAQAPPNPCRKSVSYYVPEAPVLVTNGTALQVNDQFQIQCKFKKVTREVAWPQCDDAAKTALRILQGARDAGGRNSGIVSVDGSTVGVSSSPDDGGEFRSLKLWKFDRPGEHEISCQTDNAFRFALEGEETYLKAAISVGVGVRTDGRTFRGFEPNTATPIRVRPTASEAMPRLQGLVMESAQETTLPNKGAIRSRSSAIEFQLIREHDAELQAIAATVEHDGGLTRDTKQRLQDLNSQLQTMWPESGMGIGEVMYMVMKEAIVDMNRDKRYFASKLKVFNEMSEYIDILANEVRDPAALASRLTQPVDTETGYQIGLAVPRDREVLSCVTTPSKPSFAGISFYDVWAKNTSDNAIEAGLMISWRAYVAPVPGPVSETIGDRWTNESSLHLQATLPIGDKILVGSESVYGKIIKCELWAH